MDASALQQPSFIMTAGMRAAAPVANFENWWSTFASVVKLASSPNHLISLWLMLISFGLITVHHIMMLIEFHLALSLSTVLLPWGIWRASAGLGEFALGWLIGSLIRALVSVSLLGIALPAFDLLTTRNPQGVSLMAMVLPQALGLAVGSFIFLVLCVAIPAGAARMAGHASLGLTGSAVISTAMSLGRFGLMARGVVHGVQRVVSPMLRR